MLAPSKPYQGLTAQVESFIAAKSELDKLFPHHWRELALDQDKVPLGVDWTRYEILERQGVLLLVTLRKAGNIVGYYMGFILPHLHYRTCRTLTMDIYWTHPSVRGGTAGRRLMNKVHEEAKKRGVHRIVAISKNHKDSSRLFKALGYTPIETVHSKWIGD